MSTCNFSLNNLFSFFEGGILFSEDLNLFTCVLSNVFHKDLCGATQVCRHTSVRIHMSIHMPLYLSCL